MPDPFARLLVSRPRPERGAASPAALRNANTAAARPRAPGTASCFGARSVRAVLDLAGLRAAFVECGVSLCEAGYFRRGGRAVGRGACFLPEYETTWLRAESRTLGREQHSDIDTDSRTTFLILVEED